MADFPDSLASHPSNQPNAGEGNSPGAPDSLEPSGSASTEEVAAAESSTEESLAVEPGDGDALEVVTAPPRERSNWICPSCVGVGSTVAGNCPKCGLALEPFEVRIEEHKGDPEYRSMRWRLLLAIALTLPLVLVSIDGMFGAQSFVYSKIDARIFFTLEGLLATPVVLLCGFPILVRAWRSVRTARVNVFTLTGLGIAAAYVFSLVALFYIWMNLPLLKLPVASVRIGQAVVTGMDEIAPVPNELVETFFESAAVIVVLTLLGQLLELRARARTESAIRKLLNLVPAKATVILPDGEVAEWPLENVLPGDRVRVDKGQRIPVDGIIREGSSTVDESPLTGEPVRSARSPGMIVSAGTENGLGVLVIETLRVRDQSVLGRVIHLVDTALRSRIPLQRTVDRMIRWLIPFVLAASATTFVCWVLFGPPGSVTTGITCAVGVLVVSCPVALGLATPTAVAVGMARAARAGILFRDGGALERFGGVNTILFDKTGTLTEGKMKLSGISPNVGFSEEEVLSLAAAVERGSEHPIGLSIVWGAVSRMLHVKTAESVETVPGKGVRGLVDGRQVVVGSLRYLRECGCDRELMMSEASSRRSQGRNVIFVGYDTHCIGLIIFEDPIRGNAKAAVTNLRESGVRLVLVSGDHEETARAVSQIVGIDEVIADTLPVEKFAVVERLKKEGERVAMCGDGINDAPALAAADVGIAMGTGSQAAITIAGVTLVHPDLRTVAEGRDLSRQTVRTIRQNLTLAFAFTIISIPIAAGALIPLGGGLLSPVWASFAMAVSSLAIVVNPLRKSGRLPGKAA